MAYSTPGPEFYLDFSCGTALFSDGQSHNPASPVGLADSERQVTPMVSLDWVRYLIPEYPDRRSSDMRNPQSTLVRISNPPFEYAPH